MILRAGEGRGFISILDGDPDGGHIFEGAFANILGVNERVGGFNSEGVRTAVFKIEGLRGEIREAKTKKE